MKELACEKQQIPAGVEYKRLGYSLFIAFSSDRMECRCSYLPAAGGSVLARGDLDQFLAQSSVKAGIDEDQLQALLAAASERRTVLDLVVARGIPPVNGNDGRFHPTAKASIVAHHETDDGTPHDFRNVQTFINVLAGQEVGRISPNSSGVPGRKVTGEVAIPRHGRSLKLRLDRSVRSEIDGDGVTVLYAVSAGRLCVTGDEVAIAKEYRVLGNVDFRVGSIDFNGVVEVVGDVLDGFNVTATRGVTIRGNVGNCRIVSEDDVALCGIDGQGRGTIVCGGSLRANYLHDCRVECAGDVKVATEIHNADVFALGRVVVERGGIVGGSCTALCGIDAGKVGSLTSIPTKVTSGVDYRDLQELEQLQADLALNHQLLQSAFGEEMDALRMARSVLTDRIMSIRRRVHPGCNGKINVRKLLHEKVLLGAGFSCERTWQQVSGPVSIIENSRDGGLRFLKLTPLEIRAYDLEQAYVKGL